MYSRAISGRKQANVIADIGTVAAVAEIRSGKLIARASVIA